MTNDKELKEKLVQSAKFLFGTTDSCERAGFILPDGSMLDFGNPDNKNDKNRYLDHSDIWQVFDDDYNSKIEGTDNLVADFVDHAEAVRVLSSKGIYALELPWTNVTKEQWNKIEDCSCRPNVKRVDFETFSGNDRWSGETEEGTNCVDRVEEVKRGYAKRTNVLRWKKNEPL